MLPNDTKRLTSLHSNDAYVILVSISPKFCASSKFNFPLQNNHLLIIYTQTIQDATTKAEMSFTAALIDTRELGDTPRGSPSQVICP